MKTKEELQAEALAVFHATHELAITTRIESKDEANRVYEATVESAQRVWAGTMLAIEAGNSE